LTKFVLISDYFSDEIVGGGEINNEVLADLLRQKGHSVIEEKSSSVVAETVMDYSDHCFIVGNFINLLEEVKESLRSVPYIIYEHDHKYLKTRNPADYPNYKAPPEDIVNYEFYYNALAVICQSEFHANIVAKNLPLENIISFGGNLWSDKQLEKLEKMIDEPKADRFSVLQSPIMHKNAHGAIKYCMDMEKEYELISSQNPIDFLDKLGRNKYICFLPKTAETLSRIVVEARMMEVAVITNNLVGATKEEWFKLKGRPLIEKMRQKKRHIVNVIEDVFAGKAQSHFYTIPEKKLVSVVVPAYNNEEYIDKALNDLVKQTYDKIEVIIVDDGSTDNTAQVCKQYADRYDNFFFFQKENGGTGSALNFGFSKTKGHYGTWASSDDRRNPLAIEKMVDFIEANQLELIFTAYHSQRFNRDWRSYVPTSEGHMATGVGFNHDNRPSGRGFVVNDWVHINHEHCQSGVSFLFTMDLKNRCGDYLLVPGEDYHMAVKMGIEAKDNRVGYLDSVLGWHRFPSDSLTSKNPMCVLEAEKITKKMIYDWKKEK